MLGTIWHIKNILTGGLGRCPVSFMFFADVAISRIEQSKKKIESFLNSVWCTKVENIPVVSIYEPVFVL